MTVGTGRLPDVAAAAAALSCWGIGGTAWPTSCRGVAMSPRVSRICFATMLLTFAPTDRRGFLPPAPSSRDGRARARAPPAEAIPPALTTLTALMLSWAEREEKGAPPPPLGSGVLEEEGVNWCLCLGGKLDSGCCTCDPQDRFRSAVGSGANVTVVLLLLLLLLLLMLFLAWYGLAPCGGPLARDGVPWYGPCPWKGVPWYGPCPWKGVPWYGGCPWKGVPWYGGCPWKGVPW
jgi:hypothetical protein